MKFIGQKENEIFDIIIDRYKIDYEFDDEPMDGDDTEEMAESIATNQGWDINKKNIFLNYANIKEGNVNPSDYNIELNEKKMKSEKDRMKELVKMFSKKDEIYVPKSKKDDTNEGLTKEYSVLKNLASGKANADFKENYMAANDFGMGGKQGTTVSTIADQMYDNPATGYQPIRQPLIPEEGISLAIKRTLKSGAPVKDMGFYDEVNWHLMSLGFPAKNALDIKNVLLRLIEID